MRLRLFLHPPATSSRTFSFILMDHEFVLGYRVQIYILIYLSLLLICTMCSHVDFLCYTIHIQLCLFSGTLSDSSVWITDAMYRRSLYPNDEMVSCDVSIRDGDRSVTVVGVGAYTQNYRRINRDADLLRYRSIVNLVGFGCFCARALRVSVCRCHCLVCTNSSDWLLYIFLKSTTLVGVERSRRTCTSGKANSRFSIY